MVLHDKIEWSKLLESVKCPYCESSQKELSCVKQWHYGIVSVSRFECSCGKDFNFYKGSQNSWTIPKSKRKK